MTLNMFMKILNKAGIGSQVEKKYLSEDADVEDLLHQGDIAGMLDGQIRLRSDYL